MCARLLMAQYCCYFLTPFHPLTLCAAFCLPTQNRWSVCFREQQLPKMEKPISPGPSNVVMNNYTGIGLDAAIALDFHLAREENPDKFSSR